MENMYNATRHVNELFNKNDVRGTAYPLKDNILEVHIDGDWKHDHIYGKDLLSRNYNCDIECVRVYDSDSDWYEAVYHVTIN